MAALEGMAAVYPEIRKRGIRVLPGGDYGFPNNPIGRNARDLELFVDVLGFTPLEALRGASHLALAGHSYEVAQLPEVELAQLPDSDVTGLTRCHKSRLYQPPRVVFDSFLGLWKHRSRQDQERPPLPGHQSGRNRRRVSTRPCVFRSNGTSLRPTRGRDRCTQRPCGRIPGGK